MENIFIKCDCYTHGMEVEIDKADENPTNTTFMFSMWQYTKKTKPSFIQRWKYFWTGNNDLINDYVIMDIKKATELSKYLTSNIDKINLDIKKYNSSESMIKNLIKKSEENMGEIFKKKSTKTPKKEEDKK